MRSGWGAGEREERETKRSAKGPGEPGDKGPSNLSQGGSQRWSKQVESSVLKAQNR